MNTKIFLILCIPSSFIVSSQKLSKPVLSQLAFKDSWIKKPSKKYNPETWKYKTFKILVDKGAKSYSSMHPKIKVARRSLEDISKNIYNLLYQEEKMEPYIFQEKVRSFLKSTKRDCEKFLDDIKDEISYKFMLLGGLIIPRSYKIFLVMDVTLDELVDDFITQDENYKGNSWTEEQRKNFKYFLWAVVVAGIKGIAAGTISELYDLIKEYILETKNYQEAL